MVDTSVWYEALKGEDTGQPSAFKITVFSIVFLMFVSAMLDGVRSPTNIAQIIINLVFAVISVVPIAVYGTAFLKDKSGALEGFGMWFIGGIPLFLDLFAGVNVLSFLEDSGSFLPALSYLSSVVTQAGSNTAVKVNNVYAPVVETWLIFSLAIVLLYFSKEKLFSDRSDLFHIVFAGTPLSGIFAVLHGSRSPEFFLFSSGFMFLSLAFFMFEEATPGDRVKVISASIGFLASVHATVNISASGGLRQFLSSLLSAGDFGSLLAFVLYTFGYGLGLLYWIRWGWRKLT